MKNSEESSSHISEQNHQIVLENPSELFLSSTGIFIVGLAITIGIVSIRSSPLINLFSGKVLGSFVSKKALGLGFFIMLTGGIFLISDQVKTAPSNMEMNMDGGGDMSGGDMTDMMRVNGASNPIPVTVETLKPQLLEASITYTGSIEPDRVITIYPRVSGELTNYSVYAGDRVFSGQKLAQLKANERSTEVSEAQRETNVMRTSLAMSEMRILEQKNAIKKVEAELKYLRKKLDRFAMLVREGAISQDDYDVVESEVEAQEATRSEAQAKLSRLEARIVNDRAKIQQAEAKEETALVMENYTTIQSPVTGIVQEIMNDPGVVVRPEMGILKIGDYRRLRLQANVAQQDANKIRLGSPIIAKIPNTDRTIQGEITTIFPQSDPQTRTVTVEALVDNPDENNSISGQFIEMEIITKRQANVLTIPQSAVTQIQNQTVVWVVENQKPRRQTVTLGSLNNNRIEVLEGLQSGQTIIVTGQSNRLTENSAIKIVAQSN